MRMEILRKMFSLKSDLLSLLYLIPSFKAFLISQETTTLKLVKKGCSQSSELFANTRC